ncbi:MAG: ABC transporter ATP-binding protein [Bacilli bacterium]|jgi:ABC-type lipoprotein export system ATPase subunit|nr:ABC transporter ATP-binding protein [Bacilli bacterium]MDD4005644.1 ABC transporter ATP-binding protein [Bacilli bacterium]
MNNVTLLRIDNLSKSFPQGKEDYFVLKKINLSLCKKGMVLLSGKSGSGKSTLLNLIAGIISPTSGNIIYKEADVATFKAKDMNRYRNQEIGLVFQHYNLFEKQSVLFNVILPLLIAGKGISKAYEEGRLLLAHYQMSDFADKEVEKLSGGEKQRVAVMRAIINNPAIVLADEPTGALDRKNAEITLSMLKEISHSRLVIIVSHDVELAMRFADRHIQLQDGFIKTDEYVKKDVATK